MERFKRFWIAAMTFMLVLACIIAVPPGESNSLFNQLYTLALLLLIYVGVFALIYTLTYGVRRVAILATVSVLIWNPVTINFASQVLVHIS